MIGRIKFRVNRFLLAAIAAALIVPLSSCGLVTDPKNVTASEGLPASEASGVPTLAALNLDALGRVLRGYDAVSYFEADQAILGKEDLFVFWKGGYWHFNSPENKAKFEANPEKYAPENGGYCTFGVVLSKKFDIDPTVWLLHGEKLYVFLDENVKEKFLQDTAGNFQRVRNNWPSIEDKFPQEL